MKPNGYWPHYLPRSLARPYTTLHYNLEVAAARYGSRTAIGFFGHDIDYRQFRDEAERFAGWLHVHAGVAQGERVMIYMQNAPQWMIAFYGILRANAVAVPTNPMYRAEELKKQIDDCGAAVIVCAQELAEQALQAAEGSTVRKVVTACYADYLPQDSGFALPDWLTAPRREIQGCAAWSEALACAAPAPAMLAQPDDLATLNYTSGSTGAPKGCMHTHQTFMHTLVGLATWHSQPPGTVYLGLSPMYQVAGLVQSVLSAIYVGGTVVPLPRWDRRMAAQLIERYRVHFAGMAPTAVGDLVTDPELDRYDLSSLKRVSFGGATMPEAVWQRVQERLGLSYIEAYGLTETATTTHINPIDRPKRQCLGVPFFDTEAMVLDTETLQACPPNQPGEILMRGPQLFKGYWNQPGATAEAFVEIGGKRWFRSGDIGYMDEEGYFFMTDRAKRMINASGFKVWPAEVETALYAHPDVHEACVVGARDPRRGETVKAIIALRPESRGRVSEEDIIAWAKERMAAYKYPRVVEFVDALPKTPVGKILWRELQDAEARRAGMDKDKAGKDSDER